MCEYWLHSCGHTTKTPCPRPKQTAAVQGQQSRHPSVVQGSQSHNASDTPSRNGSTARAGSNASSILTPSTPSDSSTITFTNPFASGLANALAACKDRIANNPANSCKGMPDRPRESQDPCYPCVLEDAQRKTLEEGPEVEQKLAQVKRDGFYQRGRGGWADDAYGVDGLGGQSGGYSGGGFPAGGGGFRGRGAGRGAYVDRGFGGVGGGGGRGGPGSFGDHRGFGPGPGPRGGFAPGDGHAGVGHGGFAPAGGHGVAYGQDANGYNDFGGGGWGRGGGLSHPGGPAHAAFHGNNNGGFNGGFAPQQQNFGPGPAGFQGGGFLPPNGMATPGMAPATPCMMPAGMVDHGMFAPGQQSYGPGPQGFAPGPNAGFAPNDFGGGGHPYGGYF